MRKEVNDNDERIIKRCYKRHTSSVLSVSLDLEEDVIIKYADDNGLVMLKSSYWQKYEFARSKGCDNVSDAFDKYGIEEFNNMYKQSKK